MAPEIEPVQITERPAKFSYFTINLERGEQADVSLFDSQMAQVAADEFGQKMGKFIVSGDEMFIFSSKVEHSAAYASIKGLAGRDYKDPNLKSAGYVHLAYRADGQTVLARGLSGESTTLVGNGLDMDASNQYKLTLLKEKLGEEFRIS